MSSNMNQAELSILSCKNYLQLKHRDSFLLEIGRLQVWAIVFPELLEREEYKELISIFDRMKIGMDRINFLRERLSDCIGSNSFDKFYSNLTEDICMGNDSVVLHKVSKHFSYLFDWYGN